MPLCITKFHNTTDLLVRVDGRERLSETSIVTTRGMRLFARDQCHKSCPGRSRCSNLDADRPVPVRWDFDPRRRTLQTMFTAWEILLNFFEIDHENTCSEYLEKRPPTEKLVEDFAYEFIDCPGLSREEYLQLVDHFKRNAPIVERLSYAKILSESDAMELLESFPLSAELKCRIVDLSKFPGTRSRSSETPFEIWRQDDNGNEFLVTAFPRELEARLYRKQLERRGHKQHYWVKSRNSRKLSPGFPHTDKS